MSCNSKITIQFHCQIYGLGVDLPMGLPNSSANMSSKSKIAIQIH